MKEKIMYSAMLFVCAAGAYMEYKNRPAERKNRGTWYYTVKLLVKKLILEKLSEFKPLEKVGEKFREFEKEAINQEIYDGVLLLKNLAVAEQQHAFSADFMYEKLMENSRKLKPAYSQMITLYRNGKDDEAFNSFSEMTGTRAGQNFSMILARLDQINPAELVDQMEVFREVMSQQRMTDNLKRVQRRSLITTAASAAVFFVMIMDFAAVVLFMNTLDMMKNVF